MRRLVLNRDLNVIFFSSSFLRWHSLSACYSRYSSRPSSDTGVVAWDDQDPELPGVCAIPLAGLGRWECCSGVGVQIRGRLEPFSLGEGSCLILAPMHWPPVNLNVSILFLFCSFISLIVTKDAKFRKV